MYQEQKYLSGRPGDPKCCPGYSGIIFKQQSLPRLLGQHDNLTVSVIITNHVKRRERFFYQKCFHELI